MEHITVKEQLKQAPLLAKFGYYTGMLKLIPKEFELGGEWRYGSRIRRLHPFSLVYLLIVMLIQGFNSDTIESLKKETVWW